MEQAAAFSQALGKTHAIDALLFLYRHSPRGSTEITRHLKGAAASGIKIARHLERHGLVEIRPGRLVAGRPTYKISLTAAGGRIALGLSRLSAFMPVNVAQNPIGRGRAKLTPITKRAIHR